MVIAVTYNTENGEIGEHFGHAKNLKLYEIDPQGEIIDTAVIDAGIYGEGHFAMYELIEDYNVEVVICQNIGEAAANLLSQAGIITYAGATGPADEVVAALLADAMQPTTGSCGCNCSGSCSSEGCGSSCGSGCGGCH